MAFQSFTAIIAVLAFGAAALPQTALRSGHVLLQLNAEKPHAEIYSLQLQLGAEKPDGRVTATPMIKPDIERPEPTEPKPATSTGAVASADDGFEKPSHGYADAVKRKPVALIDHFLIFYWAAVIGVALTLAWFKHYVIMRRYADEEGEESEVKEVVDVSGKTVTPRTQKRQSFVANMTQGVWRWGGDSGTAQRTESGMEALEKNMWAMVLMASIGQVRMAGRGGWASKKVGPWAVAAVSIVMGTMQLTALFLIVHDIDPYAEPVTVHPSSAWGTAWTVNSMKWIMTIFMLVMMVSEAGQCVEVVQASLEVSDKRLGGAPRWLPVMMEVFQYVIALCVVWAGVTVILSFQSVPNIIYCSMAVTFISNVDEMFFECVERVFHIEADFTIDHEEPPRGAPVESPTEPSKSSRTTAQGGLLKGDMREVPEWIHTVLRCVLVFPFFFGISLFFRACNTGILPSDRVHAMGHWITGNYE